MDTVELACEQRNIRPKGLINRVRRDGGVPGVMYGNGGSATAIAVPSKQLKERLHSAASHRLIRLTSGSADLNGKHVIVKALQKKPVGGDIVHVDLYEVDLNKPLRVSVALHFVGRAAGLVDGGILSPLEREIDVECLPLEIPAAINVDVTPLKIHDVLHVSAIKLEGNVKPIFDKDFPVVTVLPPTVSEAPVAAAAAEGEAAAPAAGAAKEAAPAKEAAKK